MYLYDRSQKYGNHNYSHFHVNYKGEKSVFSIKGEMIAGKCKIKKQVSDLIKRNRNYINEHSIKLFLNLVKQRWKIMFEKGYFNKFEVELGDLVWPGWCKILSEDLDKFL